MTSPSAPPAREFEHAQNAVDLSLIQELLRLFGKAARAHQLYLPNNPVYKAAQDALRAGFLPVWEQTDELVLAFTESEVKYGGEVVLEERSKGSDSLPWTFYKDGVRELRFLRGFDQDELGRLLDILQRVRKASPGTTIRRTVPLSTSAISSLRTTSSVRVSMAGRWSSRRSLCCWQSSSAGF